MINKLKIILAILLSAGSLISLSPQAVLAVSSNPLDQACDKIGSQTSAACNQASTQNKKDPIAGPDGLINKAANIIALVAGIGAIIMILLGAFFYVTSAGNAENAAKAKARILNAFIGLIVVALAWALVRVITDQVLK